jgi:predicted dehydrogenase
VKPVRIGIIGMGHMGRHHASKALELARNGEGVELTCVTDADPERARAAASELGVEAVADPCALHASVDAVIAAVPTTHHHRVVQGALDAGCDVLVEKPISVTVAEGQSLIRQARDKACVLHVGHLEWFNAATGVLRTQFRGPRYVEVHRKGMVPTRPTDVDVVRDLMIHDIDILQQLMGEEPTRIEAVGVPVVTPYVDIANARIAFSSGCVANLTASRVAHNSVRKMRFFEGDGYLSIDFLKQSASLYRRIDAVNGVPARMEAEEFVFDPEDALLSQLRAFVRAIRERDVANGSATSALGALRTAIRVVEAIPDSAGR